MTTNQPLRLREASPHDRDVLGELLTHSHLKHFHLDWFSIYDILDEHPFLLAESEGDVYGALACPPDPPVVAWIRLFAVREERQAAELWDALWARARPAAIALGARCATALSTRGWFDRLLRGANFAQVNEVLFMEWVQGDAQVDLHRANELGIRTMQKADLPQVARVDHAAFDPVWSLSQRSLTAAYTLASLATVLEIEGQVAAYQISTASALGAHLARLAVTPGFQGQGLGRALVQHVLRVHTRRGLGHVSVNTQADNVHSQQLYHSLGFRETGQRYPLFQDSFPEAGAA